MPGENARSDPMPEVIGGEAHFTSDADLIAAGPPLVPVPEGEEPVVIPNVQRIEVQYQAYLDIEATSKRLRDKIESEPDSVSPTLDIQRRWRQLDDGTWCSDASVHAGPPGWVVVVERQHPLDKPIIHIIGRTQNLDPDKARWVSLRLAEAAVIAETGMLP